MEVRLDILDDRLEAIDAADDRERLRAYLAMWRAGEVDPLGDEGVILVVGFGEGPGPRLAPLVANDGEGPAKPDSEGGR